MNSSTAILVLQDGRSFIGKSYGATGEVFGHLAFTTAATGAQETLTTPAHAGMVWVFTSPHIGNTGFNDEDNESPKIWSPGLVVRDPVHRPSNWRSERSMTDALQEAGVVGICEVDTRAITAHLREHGSMPAAISTKTLNPDDLLAKLRERDVEVQPLETTTREPIQGTGTARVAILDLGVTQSLVDYATSVAQWVKIFGSNATAEEICAEQPDVVIISDGPGAAASYRLDVVTELLRRVPVFATGLGHLLVAKACGMSIEPLGAGHHGPNHPVRRLSDGRIVITAQSQRETATGTPTAELGEVDVAYRSLFDDTVQGLTICRDGRQCAVTAQFSPHAGPSENHPMLSDFLSHLTNQES